MPYIIETSTPRYDSAFGRKVPHVSHRAVATLDEARSECRAILRARDTSHGGIGKRGLQVIRMPENGGTVGPLPDGSVIEVEQITWPNLAWRVNLVVSLTEAEKSANVREAIVDAYNAAQS